MISESYIKDLLLSMGYIKKNHIYEKFFPSVDCYIKVDLKNRTIIYPEDRGMTISNRTTCNFSAPENFVVSALLLLFLLKTEAGPDIIEGEKNAA